MAREVLYWAERLAPGSGSPFGSSMPHGSCYAVIEDPDGYENVCGWPVKENGVCMNGHVQPERKTDG